jgi:hypothetical protein
VTSLLSEVGSHRNDKNMAATTWVDPTVCCTRHMATASRTSCCWCRCPRCSPIFLSICVHSTRLYDRSVDLYWSDVLFFNFFCARLQMLGTSLYAGFFAARPRNHATRTILYVALRTALIFFTKCLVLVCTLVFSPHGRETTPRVLFCT